MRPYFHDDQRVARLLYHAERWKDTPWVANSESIGVGVACHNLPRAILMATGALPKDFPKIVGDPTQTRHSKVSAMEKFLDARPEFTRLRIGECELMPGDLLGLRIYHCVDHLGVCVGKHFVHVLMHKNTCFDLTCVPPWSQRIEAAWRIYE